MSSTRFERVTTAHPELAAAVDLFATRLVQPGISNIDPDTLDRYLGDQLPREEITLLVAALQDSGLARVRFTIRDHTGNLVGPVFDRLSDRPEYADDRLLNTFEVEDDDIVPIVELIEA